MTPNQQSLKQVLKFLRTNFLFFIVFIFSILLIVLLTLMGIRQWQTGELGQITNKAAMIEQPSPSLAIEIEHTVQPGDSLWLIAERYLGDGQRYQEIAQLNEIDSPEVITIGQNLRLPNKQAMSKPNIQNETELGKLMDTERLQNYEIQPGDTLWDIAEQQLGDAYRWPELYRLNHELIGSNPDLIFSGETIQLPPLN